jgi:hypothetical protein
MATADDDDVVLLGKSHRFIARAIVRAPQVSKGRRL